MNLTKVIEQALNEESVAGGEGSVFGPNVGSTATAFSGDNYAPGDARNVHGLYAGVLTRYGKKSKRKKRKKQ